MKIMPFKGFNENYLSRETTTAIKGIFVFFVFLSHFSQYFPYGSEPDHWFYFVKHNSGQLVVTMFLFYSGYGIFESIKKKGTDYVKTFPKNRILKTLFHLDCAILIYFIINLILGLKFSVNDYLLSLIGWKSIGNSNWFMFTILMLYIIVYVSFIFFKKSKTLSLISATILTIAYVFIMSKFKENYWFNTAICFILGLWYSYLKDYIEKFFMRNNFIYLFLLIAATLLYYFAFKHSKNFIAYEVWVSSFTALVILISMKVNICNKVLIWLGNHVFSIYILQRVPMLIFRETQIKFSSINLTFLICFTITIAIAAVFDKVIGNIDNKIFNYKRKKDLNA